MQYLRYHGGACVSLRRDCGLFLRAGCGASCLKQVCNSLLSGPVRVISFALRFCRNAKRTEYSAPLLRCPLFGDVQLKYLSLGIDVASFKHRRRSTRHRLLNRLTIKTGKQEKPFPRLAGPYRLRAQPRMVPGRPSRCRRGFPALPVSLHAWRLEGTAGRGLRAAAGVPGVREGL